LLGVRLREGRAGRADAAVGDRVGEARDHGQCDLAHVRPHRADREPARGSGVLRAARRAHPAAANRRDGRRRRRRPLLLLRRLCFRHRPGADARRRAHRDAVSIWTAARARRLDEIAGPDGIIVGAAVDHRDSLRAAIVKKGLPKKTAAELSELKVRIAAALAPAAAVVLLDAETSAAQALAGGALPGDVALAVPLEAQGYADADVPVTKFLAEWSPAYAVRLGASACK